VRPPGPAALRLALAGLAVACAGGPARATPVVVGGSSDHPPYEFLDERGEPAGYDVELTRAIAEAMGMQVEWRLGRWWEVRAALLTGEVDALPGVSWADWRTPELDFTPAHARLDLAVFGRRGADRVGSLDELRGHSVLVHRGGIAADELGRRGMAAGIVLADSPGEALRLLAAGRHDYALVSPALAAWLERHEGLAGIEQVSGVLATHGSCYAVRAGNAALLARFAEGLAVLKASGRWEAIHRRWLGEPEPAGVTGAAAARVAALVLLPLLAVAGGAVAWSRSLRRQVAERTASLAREVAERRRAVEEVRQYQQRLAEADKLAALGVLVSGVAHEINNPNGFVLLNLPTLRAAFGDALEALESRAEAGKAPALAGLPYPEARERLPRLLDEVQDGARQVKRIVEDLKDFARREDAYRLEPVDVNAVAQAALRLVEDAVRASSSRLEAAWAEGLPRVRGSAQRIEQVVVNLVLAACRTAGGGPDRAVALSTAHDPARGQVLLCVRSVGAGDWGGSAGGVGLSVAGAIAREHGGDLTFAAGAGESAATLRLPAAPG
jgi:polar amino acid transport system substrate-binding protein